MSAPDRMHPDDLERLAALVVEGLIGRTPVSPAPKHDDEALLTAAQVADKFAVNAGWVRQHADELGAVRLGDGPRPRLRFRASTVADRLAARSTSEGSTAQEPPSRRASRRPPPGRTGTGVELLPIGGS
jgi:hypothetical protein